MNQKSPINMKRLRRVPARFSWVDHLLVRDGHFESCDNVALALYLFLTTVCNGEGVSWYSDKSIGEHLNLPDTEVARLRQLLIDAGLIAWQHPVYQVLDLNPASYDNSRFVELLRKSAKGERDSNRRRGTCVMTSPHYRIHEDQGVTMSLADVIDDMFGGEEK